MPDMRRRKHVPKESVKQMTQLKRVIVEEKKARAFQFVSKAFSLVNLVVGLVVAIIVGYKYAVYARDLHENDMWFSNIQARMCTRNQTHHQYEQGCAVQQVQREISFRTESGLYFSYYKQMVLAPSVSEGLRQLVYDNKTEHLRTINILHRFNIYQEVILGILYKILPIQAYLEYVYFYINTIFGLHGMYMIAIYMAAWLMSGTWIAGLLGTCFYILNKNDTTRLSYTIPLRESFSLPFIYVQLALLTLYFKKEVSWFVEKLCVVFLAISTFFIVLTWQFAQFVLLLELFALFGAWTLDLIDRRKLQVLYFVISGSLIAVCILQFGNDMILASMALSFSFAGITVTLIQRDFFIHESFFLRIIRVLLLIVAVFTLSIALNALIKFIVKVDSDEHVFKFLMAKLGYGEALKRDFDALLYLCEGAFRGLPFDTFERLTEGFVFPCYLVSFVLVLLLLVASVFHKWRNPVALPPSWSIHNYPEIGFQVILSTFFAAMALSTLRMKFLWTPHMCMLAAGIFCHQDCWRWFFVKLNIQETVAKVLAYAVPCLLLGLLLWKRLPPALEELKELREFHDPDTVDLMNWINQKTLPGESFTGSMQLLAGVKLCTDRPITNHPHYENKFLRQRTKEVYQIYARKTPEEVYTILKKHGTNYIILENSICYSRQDRGCRLVDVLDIDNGHEIENEARGPDAYDPVPRFCHAIKYDPRYQKLFRKVFENRTFYLYKLK